MRESDRNDLGKDIPSQAAIMTISTSLCCKISLQKWILSKTKI